MKKKSLFILTSIVLATPPIYPAGFVRPSYSKAVQEAGATAQKQGPDFVSKSMAENAVKALKANTVYRVDEVELERLQKAATNNKSVLSAMRDIIDQSAIAQKDTALRDIQELRLKMLVHFEGIDPKSSEAVMNAQRSPEKQLELNAAIMVFDLKAVSGLHSNSKDAIRLFLSEMDIAMRAGARPDQALLAAQDALATSKGVDVDVNLFDKMGSTRDGVAELFKSADDFLELFIGSADGTQLKVMMTPRRAQEIEQISQNTVIQLVEIAKAPNVQKLMNEKAMPELSTQLANGRVFLENNPLLDSKSTEMVSAKSKADEVAANVDDLLGQLQELGAVVGGEGVRQNLARMARKYVPLAGRVIKDPAQWKRTIREKILEIDGILEKNILELDRNNQTLFSLKEKTLDQMNHLQVEMARAKLVADGLDAAIKELESRGDTETVLAIKSEVVPRIQKDLDAAMGLYGIYKASIEGINTMTRTNDAVIANVIRLRTIAAPAIAITESVRQAGKTAERVMEQSDRVSKFVGRQLTEMLEQNKRTNDMLIQQAGKSIVDHKVLEDVMTGLVKERERLATEMIKASAETKKHNDKMIAVLNKANDQMRNDGLAAGVNSTLRNNRPSVNNRQN